MHDTEAGFGALDVEGSGASRRECPTLGDTVEGHFERGDVIRILGPGGEVLGCGRAGYSHAEAAELMGQRGQKPLIHYDYLYLTE